MSGLLKLGHGSGFHNHGGAYVDKSEGNGSLVDKIFSPTPDKGSLYEKHKGPRKYEGAGGNLKGGVTYDLPYEAIQHWLQNKLGKPKRNLDKWKNLTDINRSYGDPGIFDVLKWMINYIGRWPSIHEVSKVYDIMQTARPEELGDVLVNAGFSRYDRKYDRAARNERNPDALRAVMKTHSDLIKEKAGGKPVWDIEKNPYLEAPGLPDEDGKYQRGKGFLIGSPHFQPMSNEVNWTPRKALIHELGHAVDYNKSILGSEYMDPDSTKAKLRKLLNYAYGLSYNTGIGKLNIEHEGWREGFDTYLEGAAMKGMKWDAIKDVIREAVETKNHALGSYWRHTAGDAAGSLAGLGFGATVYKFPPWKATLGKSLKGRGVRAALGLLAGTSATYASSPFFQMAANPMIESIIASRGTDEAVDERVENFREDFNEKQREHA